MGIQGELLVPQRLDLRLRVFGSDMAGHGCEDFRFHQIPSGAFPPIVQALTAAVPVPEGPADGIDHPVDPGKGISYLVDFVKKVHGRSGGKRKTKGG